jgi:hypothetical protein
MWLGYVLPVMSAALLSPADGRGRAEYTFEPGLHSGDGISRGGFGVASGGRSATWAAVPGDRAGFTAAGARIPGAGTGVPGAEERVPESGAKAVVFSGECCHLAGEVLNLLQKCGFVRGWINARERRLGCDLEDAVRTAACCGVQAALRLAGEDGLIVGW